MLQPWCRSLTGSCTCFQQVQESSTSTTNFGAEAQWISQGTFNISYKFPIMCPVKAVMVVFRKLGQRLQETSLFLKMAVTNNKPF